MPQPEESPGMILYQMTVLTGKKYIMISICCYFLYVL